MQTDNLTNHRQPDQLGTIIADYYAQMYGDETNNKKNNKRQ